MRKLTANEARFIYDSLMALRADYTKLYPPLTGISMHFAADNFELLSPVRMQMFDHGVVDCLHGSYRQYMSRDASERLRGIFNAAHDYCEDGTSICSHESAVMDEDTIVRPDGLIFTIQVLSESPKWFETEKLK